MLHMPMGDTPEEEASAWGVIQALGLAWVDRRMEHTATELIDLALQSPWLADAEHLFSVCAAPPLLEDED